MSTHTSANLTREETAARSAAIRLRAVRVELDLSNAPDADATGFATTTTLRFDAIEESTWVDFLGESVDRVVVNGADHPVLWDGARVRLTGLGPENEVRIEAVGRYNRSGEGLHRFVDPADGQTYLYTQYEPADARRVMAAFEQPDMKATYTFVVTAPSGWHVLSNGRPVVTSGGGRTQTVEFSETRPISSYITAVAAGPYHRVTGEWTGSSGRVPLGAYCRASLAEYFDADEILKITRQGLDFFTAAFDIDYPWGSYDQVFVPEYNLGAMENPGLVTFTEAYVFRGAATQAQHEARANTILHEMAHMWFGDLVTMRWWDDLWLKESFADYMGSHASVAATRFTEAWTSFANRRKAWAYEADQLPTTHPIVADIPDLEAAKLNFDGITYAKGASVLKQLVAYVGEEAFFAAAHAYFADHAYGNTTLADLLAALERASGRDMGAWADAWLKTTGVSTIRVEREGEDAWLAVEDPRPHRLRVGTYVWDADRLVAGEAIDVDTDAARAAIELGPAALVLPNAGDLTYAKVRLDGPSIQAAERGLSTIEDSLARGLVWSALWNATRDGEYAAAAYLDVVRRHAPREDNPALLAGALQNAAVAVEDFVADDRRADARGAWLETTWDALWGAAPGSDAQLAWARAFGRAAAFDDARASEIRAFLSGDTPAPADLVLDADLRWILLQALAATGHAGEEEIARELARDDTMSGHTAARRARASRPEEPVRRAGWVAAWEDQALTNDALAATIAGVRSGGRRDLVADLDADYFARIRPVWESRSIEIARRLVRGLFPHAETLEAVDGWLEDNADAPGALVRLVREERDHLARSLFVRSVQ
ncbi:aminopeptidase N [Microbacterium sp. ZXX196]|uniref:aminopeptidase N n=1 Tax=Microbacterium sp. ZXX196 TaxID=2609291 RepID=UPI0012B92402|nr:aminopeptidase N [Microbacterium sp. ZXX196]MTE24427.1 aminopeptidase N [Microbacterium sp. ZXX196]